MTDDEEDGRYAADDVPRRCEGARPATSGGGQSEAEFQGSQLGRGSFGAFGTPFRFSRAASRAMATRAGAGLLAGAAYVFGATRTALCERERVVRHHSRPAVIRTLPSPGPSIAGSQCDCPGSRCAREGRQGPSRHRQQPEREEGAPGPAPGLPRPPGPDASAAPAAPAAPGPTDPRCLERNVARLPQVLELAKQQEITRQQELRTKEAEHQVRLCGPAQIPPWLLPPAEPPDTPPSLRCRRTRPRGRRRGRRSTGRRARGPRSPRPEAPSSPLSIPSPKRPPPASLPPLHTPAEP